MAETEDSSKQVIAASKEIISVTSSDKQIKIVLNTRYCKGCEICVEVCPKDVLRMAVAMDRWEGTVVEIVNIDACTGCMLCENQCPDFAIEVYAEKKKKKGVKSVA